MLIWACSAGSFAERCRAAERADGVLLPLEDKGHFYETFADLVVGRVEGKQRLIQRKRFLEISELLKQRAAYRF